MEDQKPGPGLACNLDFTKEQGLEPKVKKVSKIVEIGRRGEQTSLTQTYHKRGQGDGHSAILCNFFRKSCYFAIWIRFARF